MSSIKAVVAFGLFSSMVAGHGAIIQAVGDAGGSGMALGIDPNTARDDTTRRSGQQDSTRFRANVGALGETLGGGENSLETGTKAIMAMSGDQLPQVTAGGEVTMTLHQVNGDGGGPYTCEMNADGTGQTWTDIQVTQSPPGKNSRNRQGASTDFPLKAALPADAAMTGTVAGQNNVGLIRCMNGARAGPFGGVVPVQMAGTATPAAARRAFAAAVKRDLTELKFMHKRASGFSQQDLQGLSPAEIEELKEDGEIQ